MTGEAIATGVVSGLLVLMIGGLTSRWVLPRLSSRVARMQEAQRKAVEERADRYESAWAVLADLGWGAAVLSVEMLVITLMLSALSFGGVVMLVADAHRFEPWMGMVLWVAALPVGLFLLTLWAVLVPFVRGMRARNRRQREAAKAAESSPAAPSIPPIDFKSS